MIPLHQDTRLLDDRDIGCEEDLARVLLAVGGQYYDHYGF
jgi:hypothetical protein